MVERVKDPKKYLKKVSVFFFKTEIGPKLAANLSDSFVDFSHFSPKVNSSFRLSETDNNTELKLLKSLKTDKAAGLENISGKLLKEAAPVVASSLCMIFQMSGKLQTVFFMIKAKRKMNKTITDLFQFFQFSKDIGKDSFLPTISIPFN